MIALSVVWAADVDPSVLTARLAEVAPVRALRTATRAPTIAADAYARVATGETVTGMEDVPGERARVAWGVAIVDVPVSAMFSAINDDKNKADYTRLSHARIVEGSLCAAERTVFQMLEIPLITDRWWVIEQRINLAVHQATSGRAREMSWTKVPDGVTRLGDADRAVAAGGMEVSSTEGGWFLVDLDGSRTLVEFWAWSDPGGNVPVRLAQSFASGSIETTLQSMAQLARTGPACSL